MSAAPQDPTNTNPIAVTAIFSENVSGFTNSDIVVTNGTSSGFTIVDGKNYTFNIIPTADGVVTVNIPQNVSQDAATNGNTVSNTITRTFDATRPTVSMSAAPQDPTNTNPIAVSAIFSETVT